MGIPNWNKLATAELTSEQQAEFRQFVENAQPEEKQGSQTTAATKYKLSLEAVRNERAFFQMIGDSERYKTVGDLMKLYDPKTKDRFALLTFLLAAEARSQEEVEEGREYLQDLLNKVIDLSVKEFGAF